MNLGAVRLGYAAALLQLVLAAALAILVLLISPDFPDPDAVPRPLVLGALYATPAVIAMIGVRWRRPSLLVAAATALIVGAFLSFSGVTLVFFIPALLMLSAALRMRAPHTGRPFGVSVAVAGLVAVLIIAAGWLVLFALTDDRCVTADGAVSCSSAALTVAGGLAAAACLGLAIGVAVLAVVRREAAGLEASAGEEH